MSALSAKVVMTSTDRGIMMTGTASAAASPTPIFDEIAARLGVAWNDGTAAAGTTIRQEQQPAGESESRPLAS